MNDEITSLVEGTSEQTKHANSLWIALIVLATVVILPSQTADGQRTLPFSLGNIPSTWFYFVSAMLLAVLYIAFASAQVQISRAHVLAQMVVDAKVTLWDKSRTHPRDLYDVAVTPALNRVGPLAQACRGKFQFYGSTGECPLWLRRATTLGYIFLKTLSGAVYFGFPASALAVTAWRSFQEPAPLSPVFSHIAMASFLVGAALASIPLVMLEVTYVRNAAKSLRASTTTPPNCSVSDRSS